MRPKNYPNASYSSFSDVNSLYWIRISENSFKIKENIATPKRSMIEMKRRSILLLGFKSPRPTVESEVNEK